MAPEAIALGSRCRSPWRASTSTTCRWRSVLEELPDDDLTGAMLQFTSGKAAGHNVWISGVRDGYVTTGIGQVHFDALRGVAVGDDVLIDNTAYLAFQTYHRHQVPPDDYPEWDQFRAAGRADLPAAPRAARPALRAQRRCRAPERPLRRQDDRGPVPARRGCVSAAGGLVPPAGRGGARPAHRRPVPAVVRRPCDARRARRAARRDDASREEHADRQLPRRAGAGAPRRGRVGGTGRRAARRAPATSSSTVRSSSRRPRPTAGASSRS